MSFHDTVKNVQQLVQRVITLEVIGDLEREERVARYVSPSAVEWVKVA